MEARNDSMQSTFTFLMDQVPSISHEKHVVPPLDGTKYFQTTTTSSPFNNDNQQAILNPHKNHVHHHTNCSHTICPPKLQLFFFEGREPLDWHF